MMGHNKFMNFKVLINTKLLFFLSSSSSHIEAPGLRSVDRVRGIHLISAWMKGSVGCLAKRGILWTMNYQQVYLFSRIKMDKRSGVLLMER